MKKLMAFTLLLVLMFSVAACENENTKPQNSISKDSLIGLWQAGNTETEALEMRYAFYEDGTFLYAASQANSLNENRELFKTGQWSIAGDTLRLEVKARFVLPVGNMDDVLSNDSLIKLEEGLLQLLNNPPEVENYHFTPSERDLVRGKDTVSLEGETFYDCSGQDNLFKEFYDLKIPFIADEKIVGDPPEGALTLFEAQELLAKDIAGAKEEESWKRQGAFYLYRGIEEWDNSEHYQIDLYLRGQGEAEPIILHSYLVGLNGALWQKSDDGTWMRRGGKDLPEQKTAFLYTNMTSGMVEPEIKEHPWDYSGELTAEVLAEGLSQLTGLDFFISVKQVKDGLVVDWDKKSTLLANLDNREQKEEFHFFDAEAMRWFMMDSLWLTLTRNLQVENIYYSMDGGQDLVFEELSPLKEFPADLPYMGSAFFFAHEDGIGRGDLIE